MTAIFFFTVLRPFNRFTLLSLLLILCGMRVSGCFRRRPARITPTTNRQDRWLPWSMWSSCSASCGAGHIFRQRICRRGQKCSKETEMKMCVGYHCNDGNVAWTQWSSCSVTCGQGWKERSRPCPKSEQPCREFLVEKNKCDAGHCPIDGGLSSWGPWSTCSTTCGVGTATRFRNCTNPLPQYGGADCRDPMTSKRSCSLSVCPPKVQGQWNSWGPWSSCSRTCKEGLQKRIRLCNNTAPAYGGNPCLGSSEETKPCVEATYCEKPVHGQWSPWGAWNECSVRCSNGTRVRLRYCNNPAPKFGGQKCSPGKAIQVESCREICPINGGWGPWKPIRECRSNSGKCSKGSRHYSRKCDNPAPQHGGTPCRGKTITVLDCWDARGCSGDLQPPADFLTQSFKNKTVSVTWRQAPYGIVPEKFQIYFQPTPMPSSLPTTKTIIALPSGPDTPADGHRYSQQIDVSNLSGSVTFWVTSVYKENSKPSAKHNLVVGEVDGGWSAWDSWSTCSKTCGTGTQTRRRRCDSPTRTPKGRSCFGKGEERTLCDEGFC